MDGRGLVEESEVRQVLDLIEVVRVGPFHVVLVHVEDLVVELNRDFSLILGDDLSVLESLGVDEPDPLGLQEGSVARKLLFRLRLK